jgi:hypothetical protein
LAITSGVLIGSSFVFKKKGLLRSQAGGELGEGVAYLKSVRMTAAVTFWNVVDVSPAIMVDRNEQYVLLCLWKSLKVLIPQC